MTSRSPQSVFTKERAPFASPFGRGRRVVFDAPGEGARIQLSAKTHYELFPFPSMSPVAHIRASGEGSQGLGRSAAAKTHYDCSPSLEGRG
jgi:hypothetical protein